MAAKKPDPLDKMTKPALITLVKKLQKQVVKLEEHKTVITRERPALPGVEPCKPFPWEPK